METNSQIKLNSNNYTDKYIKNRLIISQVGFKFHDQHLYIQNNP
jgi:hypothetical protein